jgi:HTH-type transcriptional regulator/antitoxin HigA
VKNSRRVQQEKVLRGATMEINIITSDEENRAMGKRLDAFIETHPDLENLSKKDAEEFELLCMVIKNYEDKRYPEPEVDPIDFIKFMMEQKDLKVKDIAGCFGTASRAYEVLNRKRNLTLAMIKKLRVALGCPADALIEA